MKIGDVVASVLGETRRVTDIWPSGHHICPFCGYASLGPCYNPACEGNPQRDPALAQKAADEARQRAEERAAAERREAAAWEASEARAAEDAAWRRRQIDEAERRGACLRCLFRPGRSGVKFVRHRGTCPKGRP